MLHQNHPWVNLTLRRFVQPPKLHALAVVIVVRPTHPPSARLPPTGALQPGTVSWAPAPVNGRPAVGAAAGQPGAQVKPEQVDPVLAATVPVIRDLALRMSRLVRRLVPADQQAALQALKEDVAQVAAALASARAKGG